MIHNEAKNRVMNLLFLAKGSDRILPSRQCNFSNSQNLCCFLFKTKLVLELLQNKSTLVQIASKHNILPQNLQNWKKTFLANAEIAMEPSKAVKEYKEELIKSQKQNERLDNLKSDFKCPIIGSMAARLLHSLRFLSR
jgi:putative transposase